MKSPYSCILTILFYCTVGLIGSQSIFGQTDQGAMTEANDSLILSKRMPALATDKGESLNAPIPEAARQSFARGLKLERSDRYAEALVEFKKAFELAPNYLGARAEYITAESYDQGREAQVRAEYQALMVKEPDNPVYPMALALGQQFAPAEAKRAWLEKVVALAPEWSWGHYAKARLAEQTQPEAALAESLKTIELAPEAPQAYATATSILEKLKRFDEADALAEKLATGEETRRARLLTIWRLRLARAGGSDEAKSKLKEELGRLASGSIDMETLTAVYSAYTALLKDKDGAKSMEPLILRVDPKWYPERGTFTISFTIGRTVRRVIETGWQAHLAKMLHDGDLDQSKTDPKERIARLEQLFQLNPGVDVRREIQKRLLSASVTAADLKRTLNYGEALLKDDPEDVDALLALAKALTDQKVDPARALAYSRRALVLTTEFHLVERAPEVDSKLFDVLFSKERQQGAYNQQRADALYTYASILSQAGQYKEAEDTLRESLAVTRSEAALSQLEVVVRKLGRAEEADKLAVELKTLWMTRIRINFKTEPAKDFEVSTLDGRKLKLSDLRGKVVIVSFWATWCVPCREEMPHLVELYNKYKSRGLEIVAVSSDAPEDRSKVVAFAKEYKLTFPVATDQGAVLAYGVNQYPTTNFIDAQGRLRYQSLGFDSKNGARDLEFVVEEILKAG
jgi:peroxiredoxin/tetratricopeptide (TPR) repeat protein